MSDRSVTFTNGDAVIESARVVVDLPDVLIVEADMRTKYAAIDGYGGDEDVGEVFIGTTPESLYADSSVSHSARITVRGLDGDGWICVADCARYTASACWYRRSRP